MIHGGRQAATLLFFGDITTFIVALWLTLLVRYQALPSPNMFADHIEPFSILFIVWALVFYMSGLYGKRIILFKSSLPNAILKTQVFNIIIAALFFFLTPGVGIAPKTNLIIYLVISLVLIFVWRLAIYPRISNRRSRYQTVLIAKGKETDELVEEVNGNDRYHLVFRKVYAPHELAGKSSEELSKMLFDGPTDVLAADTTCEELADVMPQLYALPQFAEGCQFMEFADLYEEVFDRIPLSLLSQGWFLTHASAPTPALYASMKRIIDILGGLAMGLITLVAIPFIWIANRLEAPGPLFIVQDRIGERGVKVRVYKFRSMTKNEKGSGVWVGESENRVTKVGSVLRKTSLDEFPQFLNILTGELSLIGPRNDIEGLGTRLADEIPYYLFRYQVPPGITGWAQINQQYEQGHISPQSIEETKVRLAYDFYYIKHRSLGLDLVIALKTVKRMLFRVSSW